MAAAGNKVCLTESLRSAKESQCSERACEGVAVRRGVRAARSSPAEVLLVPALIMLPLLYLLSREGPCRR